MKINGRRFFERGVSLHTLDRIGFVLDEATQTIYKLNSAGALLWRLCEDDGDRDGVTSVIEAALGMTRPEAEEYLEASLKQWSELGLVAAADLDRPKSDARPSGDLSPGHGRRAGEAGKCAGLWNMHLLGKRIFKVRYASAEQERWGREAFGGWASRDAHEGFGTADSNVTVLEVSRQRGRRYSVLRDEVRVQEDLKNEYVIPALKRSMMAEAVQQSGCTFAVHAGAVHKDRQVTILPAPSGSGKTTLVAGLIGAGFGYLSDEIALIDEDLQVRPLPMSLCVKQSAWRLIGELYPCLADATTHRRVQDDNLVRYLKVPGSSLLEEDEAAPLKRIIFPRYVPEGRAEIRPLETHSGIERLLGETVLPQRLNGPAFDRALEQLRKCRYYAMESPSLAQSIELIESLA